MKTSLPRNSGCEIRLAANEDPCLWKAQILGWDATWKCFCAIHPLRKGSVYSLQGFNCSGRQLINNTAVNVTIVIDSQRWILTPHLFHAVKTLMSEEERRLACIELGQNWKGLVYITVGDLSHTQKKCNIAKMYHAIISTTFVAKRMNCITVSVSSVMSY